MNQVKYQVPSHSPVIKPSVTRLLGQGLEQTEPPAPSGRIMSSMAGSGGLAGQGGIAGHGGGLAG